MSDEHLITSEASLRSIIPANKRAQIKILDHLEHHSKHMVACARLVAIYYRTETNDQLVCLPLQAGSQCPDDKRIVFASDHSLPAGEHPVGSLWIIPGVKETLRVNGTISRGDTGELCMRVAEMYLQCPKALVRSNLWDTDTWVDRPSSPGVNVDSLSADARAFIESSPFAVVGSGTTSGELDVTPRGDPPRLLVSVLDDNTLLLPERTGNRLADTLRNVIDSPQIAIAFVHPGRSQVLTVYGQARITAAPDLLAARAVKNKMPKLGVLISVDRVVQDHARLSGWWQTEALLDEGAVPTMGRMLIDQISPGGRVRNKLAAKIIQLGVRFHKRFRLY